MNEPLHEDPQLARALHQIGNCRDLLARLERIFRLPRRYISADLSFPFRAIAASNHQLAVAFNQLADIREPIPAPPTSPAPMRPVENLVVDEGAMLIRRTAT